MENLEWCTHSQNSQHAIDNNLYKRGKSVHKINVKINEIVKKYDTLDKAAQDEDITNGSMSERIKKRIIKNGHYFVKAPKC